MIECILDAGLGRKRGIRREMLKVLLATICGLLTLASAAHGQTMHCDPLPSPGSGQPAYQARGNRCEGFYLAGYAAQSIELVSLTLGPIAYTLRAGVTLRVSTPSNSGTVHVRAVPKPPRMSYRMDANLDPGSVLTWPVDDVLLPENISASRIGVFGWKADQKDRIYVPVQVSSSTQGPPKGRCL